MRILMLTLALMLSPSTAMACKMIVFEHIDFDGKYYRIENRHNDFRKFRFNDAMSSFVVLSGRWCYYQHINYDGTRHCFRPGVYSWVEDFGIRNDDISSARCQ